jgi:hypothetical protein
MKTKTYFAFRIDVWDGDGNNIIEQLAGLDDHTMAVAAYWAAVAAMPMGPADLRQWRQGATRMHAVSRSAAGR